MMDDGERYSYSSSELLSLILTNLGWKPRVHGSSDPSNAAFMRAGCEKYRSVTLDGLRFVDKRLVVNVAES